MNYFYWTPFLEDFFIWFSVSIAAVSLIDFARGRLHRGDRTETTKIEQNAFANYGQTLDVNSQKEVSEP